MVASYHVIQVFGTSMHSLNMKLWIFELQILVRSKRNCYANMKKKFGFSKVYPLDTYRNTIAYIIVSYGQYHSTIDLCLCSSLTPE